MPTLRLALLSLLAGAGCGGTVTSVTGGTSGAGGASSTAGSAATIGASSATTTTSSATTTTTGTSSVTTATSSATTSASSSGAPSCVVTSDTTLLGVHLLIDASNCTFSLSDPATISIQYDVMVAHDIAEVTPQPQDAGQCGAPGSSGLITFEEVGGNGQAYCLCDVGLCAPPSNPPVTLKQGSYSATFTWDKRAWMGPSDTGNPEGPAFPPGDYTLTVSAVGTQGASGSQVSFAVKGTLLLHLVP